MINTFVHVYKLKVRFKLVCISEIISYCIGLSICWFFHEGELDQTCSPHFFFLYIHRPSSSELLWVMLTVGLNHTLIAERNLGTLEHSFVPNPERCSVVATMSPQNPPVPLTRIAHPRVIGFLVWWRTNEQGYPPTPCVDVFDLPSHGLATLCGSLKGFSSQSVYYARDQPSNSN